MRPRVLLALVLEPFTAASVFNHGRKYRTLVRRLSLRHGSFYLIDASTSAATRHFSIFPLLVFIFACFFVCPAKFPLVAFFKKKTLGRIIIKNKKTKIYFWHRHGLAEQRIPFFSSIFSVQNLQLTIFNSWRRGCTILWFKAKVYFTSSNYHQSLVFLLQL